MTHLVYRPFHEENIVLGLAKGSALFLKQSVSSIFGSISSVFDSFRRAVVYISSGRRNNLLSDSTFDKDLFEDDIE